MECLHCKYPHTHVVYTRQDTEIETRRRRECLRCGMRFTTIEQLREAERERHAKDSRK